MCRKATLTRHRSSARHRNSSSEWGGAASNGRRLTAAFRRREWLKPYTDDVLESLAKKGVKRVYVALPGFTVDCLETLDEIGRESKEVFEKAGGEHLKNGTCLNDHPMWIEAMARIVREECVGWVK